MGLPYSSLNKMPEWIHSRAQHLMARNPNMPESMAWGLATQQAHATGKSPKGYGTSEGRAEAKSKYTTPSDDKKTADPGGIGRRLEKSGYAANAGHLLTPILGLELFVDAKTLVKEELEKLQETPPPQKPSMKRKTAGIFSLRFIESFSDELQKIAEAKSGILKKANAPMSPTVPSQVRSAVPRNRINSSLPNYSQVHSAPEPSPVQRHQPVLSPPPVRG